MYEKRRRLLLTNQGVVKVTDHPLNICPHCGDDGTDDGGYSNMTTKLHYCDECDAFTTHYYCEFFHDDRQETCDTMWCSVCGHIHHCPECGGHMTKHTKKCATDTCDMIYYRCDDCGYIIGETGEDHEECNADNDGGNGGEVQEWNCARGCGGTSFNGIFVNMTCPICGHVIWVKCNNCGDIQCSNCGSSAGL